MPKLESIKPILAVHDVEASIAYYMEKLASPVAGAGSSHQPLAACAATVSRSSFAKTVRAVRGHG